MPPMGMAAGGIVRMQRGGFLDQYVAGAEAGPMPGGSTVRDQIDRVLESGMSYPDILSFISQKFYAQPEVLEYVQSKVGRLEPTMGDSMIPEAREMLDREPYESREARMPMLAGGSDIYKAPMVLRAADALGMFDSFKGKPEQERMAEPAASALVRDLEAQYVTPDYMTTKPGTESADPLSGMLELAQEAYTDASDPRRQLSPSIDTDALISGMVSERAPRSGGIPDLSTAPQRGAGGRPFDVGAFGDLFGGIGFDLGMPTREQGMAADRAAVERIQQKAAGAYDDPNTPEKRRARLEQLAQLGAEGPDETVQEINERLGTGPTGPVTSPFGVDGKKAGGKNVQGVSEAQAQSLSEIVVDRDRKDLSGILSKITSDGAGDSAFDRDTSLDFSDLIEDSKRMARANALMQLGAGIASGDTAKALSAAGTAATKGMQDARTLDMRARLADYQAGREDLRRGEEAERFERKLTSQESQFDKQLDQLERKIDASINVSDATSQRSILRALSEEVSSLREQSNVMTDPEKARFKTLESALYQMMGLDLSAPNVTGGLSGKDLSGLSALLN